MSSLPKPLGQPWLVSVARLSLYLETEQIRSYENKFNGGLNINFVISDAGYGHDECHLWLSLGA